MGFSVTRDVTKTRLRSSSRGDLREGSNTMAQMRFNPPIHWEAWCSWLLGIWLCISPGPLQFGNEAMTTFTAVITGVLLICIEVATVSAFRWWEEWINVVLGAWLIVAPWILSFYPNRTATANFVVVGALVVALAFYELLRGERESFEHRANSTGL